MINCEGFKAFRGTMMVSPIPSSGIKPFEISGDWLYKPEYKCWYGGGRSFSVDICTVVKDDTEARDEQSD